MSNLNSEFEAIQETITEKIRSAQKLLAEASKLATENRISVDKGDANNLMDLVNDLPVYDWEESEYEDSWSSSTLSC